MSRGILIPCSISYANFDLNNILIHIIKVLPMHLMLNHFVWNLWIAFHFAGLTQQSFFVEGVVGIMLIKITFTYICSWERLHDSKVFNMLPTFAFSICKNIYLVCNFIFQSSKLNKLTLGSHLLFLYFRKHLR